MSPCLHIIAHMGMDMAPCPYIGYRYDSMDLDMRPCPHIMCLYIGYVYDIQDLDLLAWIWI